MTLLLLLAAIVLSKKLSQIVSNTNVKMEKGELFVILDPGHGGTDPGKVGINEAMEKDINLAVAERVREKLSNRGIRVVMTREDDVSEGSKLQDMKKRVEKINQLKPDLVVSIHQNSYTKESVRGAQVFYFAKSEVGKSAAEIMQEELRLMDPENQRDVKANQDFYLLKKTEVPTIIVECGFLSNSDEAQKLVTEEYQEKIAESICIGIIKWLDK